MKATRQTRGYVWMLLVAFTLAGCTGLGGLSEKSSARIRPGMTESEVHRIFGVPRRSELGSTGRKVETFGTVHRRPTVVSNMDGSSGTLEVRALSVLYDPEGKVVKTAYSVGESPYRYYWLGPGRFDGTSGIRVKKDDLNRIKKGVTSRDELVQLCGQPTIVGFDEDGDTTCSWLFVHDREGGFFIVQEFLVLLDENSLVADFVLRRSRF